MAKITLGGSSAAILLLSTLLIASLAAFTVKYDQSVQVQGILDALQYDQSVQVQELQDQVSGLQSLFNQILQEDDRFGDAVASSTASVQRELQALPTSSCDCAALPAGHTYASNFGIIGDSATDDGPALQAAIDSAASDESGGTVILPAGVFRINTPLLVPGGVTLQGQGYGSSPLAIQFDAGGSTIAYCGTDYAVKLTGHAASLRDLAVYDWPYTGCENVQAAGGVLIEADDRLIESTSISNVFIFFFLGGPALSLVAKNEGGVAYGNYQNVRYRHAKTGVYLSAEMGSFVNSNTFIGGAISGGGYEYGINAEGPGDCNDNKFLSFSIGMYDSDVAHVFVTGSTTNLKLHDIRLEARGKSNDRPIVIIDDSSYGNVMNGILGHTHIQGNLNRNPGVDFMSQKSTGLDPAPINQFWNAAFKGFDGDRAMPGWKFEGTNANIAMTDDSDALYPDHHVIEVDKLSYGGAFKLMADERLLVPGHDFVTFGIYAKSSVQNSISAAMRYTSGSIISSGPHSGSGEWEFISMSALYSKTAPYFYFSITGDVKLTAPTLTFGQSPATPGASLISSSGARMSGTLSMGVAIALPPPPETPYYWKLPKNEGNVFRMDMQGDPFRTIIRLNDSTADRFPSGTIVTLMFPEAGTRIQNNAYIALENGVDFVSTETSSITLISYGSPSWTEVSRNESAPKPGGSVATGIPPPPETPYYWKLPKDEGTVFRMDMQGNPIRTIIRLNYSTADRFPSGTIITMLFTEAGTRVKNSGYIKLKSNVDFVSSENSSITLISYGSASWTEVSRNA